MMKFIECLNDTWDYFFLGDPECLSDFKEENNLSDDLIGEFTSNESGDLVVKQGVLIPMSGIENYPYTVFFNIDSDMSVYDDESSDLQFRKDGYILKVTSNEIYLFTIPYLKAWTENGIKNLKNNGIRPRVNLENGLYTVEILGGETIQDKFWDPTIEFLLRKSDGDAECKVHDVGFKFKIEARDY